MDGMNEAGDRTIWNSVKLPASNHQLIMLVKSVTSSIHSIIPLSYIQGSTCHPTWMLSIKGMRSATSEIQVSKVQAIKILEQLPLGDIS